MGQQCLCHRKLVRHLYGWSWLVQLVNNRFDIRNVFALQVHFVSIANVLHLHCACSSFVVSLYCACMHETHTPAFILPHSVWMACKVSLACEWQRFFKDYRSRLSFNGVPATLCGPIVCIIRNRLAIRAAAFQICKKHAHVYHMHILSSRRPISIPRLDWLHHQQTACRLSYGNLHLQ